MDDYLFIGPRATLETLTSDMASSMLLRDIKLLDEGQPSSQVLGWMIER